MGVPQGGVGDQQLLLAEDPILETLGAVLVQVLFQAGRAGDVGEIRHPWGFIGAFRGLRVLDDDVAQVFEHLGGPILGLGGGEQLRGVIDELGVAPAGQEHRVG